MKKALILLTILLAGTMLVSCQYQDDSTKSQEISALLGLVKDTPAETEAPIPRLSSEARAISLPQLKKKWTVLVYMDGDNNLSRYSSKDIREMMGSGSGDALSIVVLWDNDPDQDAQGAAERHGYFYVERNAVTLLKNTGEVNMGDPKTAKNFISYAVKNFPADHYLWIWWNHGGAVDRASLMKGVCWDDTSGGDHLSEAEQKEVMAHFKEQAGKKIDIVGFDACLMATAEIAYQYKDVASYLVASEQSEPGDGWDYSFLSKIISTPATTAQTLAKHIATCYKKYYQKAEEEDVTMSVLNLARVAAFARSLDDFAAAAMAGGSSGATYRTLSKGLPMFGSYHDGDRNCYFTKDLYGYLRAVQGSTRVPAAVREKAEASMKLLADKKLVVSEWHGSAWEDGAFGLSVTLKRATAVYRNLDLCADTRWDEFLNWAKFADNDYVY